MSEFIAPSADIQEFKKKKPQTVPFDSGAMPPPDKTEIGPPVESALMPMARLTAGTAAGMAVAPFAATAAAPAAALTGPFAPAVEAAAIAAATAAASRVAQTMVNYAGEQFGLRNFPKNARPSLGEQALQSTIGFTAEMGSQLAGNAISVLAINKIVSPLAGRYFRQPSPQLRQEAYDAFVAADQLGVPVEGMAHMIGGKRTAEMVRGLRSHPVYTYPKLDEEMRKTDEAISKVWKGAIDRFAGGAKSPTEVGNILKGGLVDGRAALGTWADVQEEAIGKSFKKTDPIRLDNFMNAYREIGDIFKVIPRGAKQAPKDLGKSIIPQELGEWTKIIEGSNGTLTYDQVRKLRTELRGRINVPLFLKTADDKKLISAYSAINDDLAAVMEKRGLSGRWAEYNGNYKSYKSEFEAVESIADSQFAYEAFDALKRGDKRAGELLWKTRKLLNVAGVKEDAWLDVVALRLMELGEKKGAPSGTFDFGTFARSMDNLDESAKRALFNIPGKGDVSKDIDRLLLLARRRASSPVPDSGTPSGIAEHNLIRNPVTYIQPLGLISGYNLGKLMTNRQFVKWLADGQGYAKMTGRGLTAHSARLAAIAATDPQIAGAVKEYYGAWRKGFNAEEIGDFEQ